MEDPAVECLITYFGEVDQLFRQNVTGDSATIMTPSRTPWRILGRPTANDKID